LKEKMKVEKRRIGIINLASQPEVRKVESLGPAEVVVKVVGEKSLPKDYRQLQ